jgi:hypothetical protein
LKITREQRAQRKQNVDTMKYLLSAKTGVVFAPYRVALISLAAGDMQNNPASLKALVDDRIAMGKTNPEMVLEQAGHLYGRERARDFQRIQPGDHAHVKRLKALRALTTMWKRAANANTLRRALGRYILYRVPYQTVTDPTTGEPVARGRVALGRQEWNAVYLNLGKQYLQTHYKGKKEKVFRRMTAAMVQKNIASWIRQMRDLGYNFASYGIVPNPEAVNIQDQKYRKKLHFAIRKMYMNAYREVRDPAQRRQLRREYVAIKADLGLTGIPAPTAQEIRALTPPAEGVDALGRRMPRLLPTGGRLTGLEGFSPISRPQRRPFVRGQTKSALEALRAGLRRTGSRRKAKK